MPVLYDQVPNVFYSLPFTSPNPRSSHDFYFSWHRRFFRPPHTVTSPGCLLIPFFLSPKIRDTCRKSSILLAACGLYASDFHLPSLWSTLSETSPPAAKLEAEPIRNERKAKSLGLHPAFSTRSLIARKAGHTSPPLLRSRYDMRKVWHICGQRRMTRQQLRHQSNGTAVRSVSRPRATNLIPYSGPYISDLNLVSLMSPETDLHLLIGLRRTQSNRAFPEKNATYFLVRQCTRCISAARSPTLSTLADLYVSTFCVAS